jgi:hypothetical protein
MRYSLRSNNLDEIAKELGTIGIDVRKENYRELVAPHKIKEENYLRVKGDNVSGRISSTSAFLYLHEGIPSEKDEKLIEYVTRKYKLPIERGFIGLTAAIVASYITSYITMLYLLLQMK